MQVFISYARENYTEAKKIFELLKVLPGAVPWMDKESLLPGSDWEESISQAIRQSRFVILLLSQHSVSKEGFIQKEVREVLDRLAELPPGKVFLIPARLEPCSVLHKELKRLHWVDLFEGWDEGISKIISVLSQSRSSLDFPLGIRVVTDGNEQFHEIFRSGQQLPCIYSNSFTTSFEGQRQVEVILSQKRPAGFEEVARVVSDVPVKQPGSSQVIVTIEIDEHKTMLIKATNIDDGRIVEKGPFRVS